MEKKEKQKGKRKFSFVRWCRDHAFSTTKIAVVIIFFVIIFGVMIYLVVSRPNAKYTSRTIDFGLKNIGEMATQAGYYTNIVTINIPNRTIAGIPMPGTSSKSIATYQGIIRAGIDFEKIVVDINEETKTVTLTMPPTRILSNEIDPDSLEVYDESNNIFNPISITDSNFPHRKPLVDEI